MKKINDLRECAIGLLARREHSRYELKQKLLIKKYPFLAVESVLVSLAEEGLQSDERFSENYVRRRAEMGFGPHRISLELSQKGINKSLINKYINKESEFWCLALSSVWQRKYDTLQGKDFRKQAHFLIQRGFSPQQVYALLRGIDV